MVYENYLCQLLCRLHLMCSIGAQTDLARNVPPHRLPVTTTCSCQCQKDRESEKFNKFVTASVHSRVTVQWFSVVSDLVIRIL